jgi:hypothetical protein
MLYSIFLVNNRKQLRETCSGGPESRHLRLYQHIFFSVISLYIHLHTQTVHALIGGITTKGIILPLIRYWFDQFKETTHCLQDTCISKTDSMLYSG